MGRAAVGNIKVVLSASAEAFTNTIAGADSSIRRLAAGAASVGSPLAGLGSSLAATAAAALGLGSGLAGALGLGIKIAADAEQAEVAFATMIGSSERAKALLSDLTDFAAKTPFDLPGLRDAAKKLLAFNTDAADVIPTLRRLGDVAAGIGVPVEDLAEIYGKARIQGRLMAEDINQLTGRGIPIIGELAKQFGVAESEVRKLVESGAVGFENLEQAFIDMTAEGGQFAGLMEAQSGTIAGVWSTAKDVIGQSLGAIGAAFVAAFDLKNVLINLSEFVERYRADFVAAVASGFEAIARAGLVVLDWIGYARAGFLGLRSVVTYSLAAALKGLEYLGSGLESVLNLIPGVEVQFSETLKAMSDDLSKLAAEQASAFEAAWNAPAFSEQIENLFGAIRAGAESSTEAVDDLGKATAAAARKFDPLAGEIQKLEERIKGQAAAVGLSADEAAVAALRQKGATDEQLAGVTAALEAKKTAEAQAKAMEEGKKVAEAARLPAEKFAAELERLAVLKEAGAIDGETFLRAARSAKQDAFGSQENDRFAAAVLNGSAAAYSAVLRFERENTQGPADDLERQALDESRKQTKSLAEIVKKVGSTVIVEMGAA